MQIRELFALEALSRHATPVPAHMSTVRTPPGKYLFHGTPLDNVLNIVRQNAIYTGANWRGEGDRVALTRSYAVAHSFGQSSDLDMFPAVLVLDWKKLAEKYEIVPYHDVDCHGEYWKCSASDDGTEQEEAVYGVIRPLSQFLVSINVEPDVMDMALNSDDLAGWAVEEKGYFKTPRGFKMALMRLSQSPIFNRITP